MKDKLVELIAAGRGCPCNADKYSDGGKFCKSCEHSKYLPCWAGIIADRLIANDVTFAADNIVGCKWISVDEEMPPEHESMFIKLYGTKQWTKAMFRTVSKEVLCRVQYADGSEAVKMLYTRDGDWTKMGLASGRVTHWMPTDRLLELLREEK